MRDPKQKRTARSLIPLRVSALYALVAGLWILFSDLVLSSVFRDPGVITRIEIFKGWAFVIITAFMLYFLITRDIAAIRRSEQAWRETEEKFQMLVHDAASAIFIYRDKILLANPAMENLTGYRKEELERMSFYDIIHHDFRKEIREHCEALQGGKAAPLRCEYKIITRSGGERWVDFTSSIITYDGEMAGLGTAFDITERKQTEAALRESEERFRLLVDRVTDYEIFMLDPQGTILSWNIGAERSKGYRPEEVINKPHSIFFTRDDVDNGMPDRELRIAAGEGRFEDEGWRMRKDGSLFWANVVTTALRDSGGNLRGYAKVVRDITERKRAEESLRASEERYRVIAETASDAIITIDEESTVVFANEASEKVFGYPLAELLGKRITVLMPERLRNMHLDGMKRYLTTGRKSIRWGSVELPGLHRRGQEVPLEISYGEFVREGRRFFTGIVRDITERKEAEKEKEYKEMLERFTQEIETRVAERTMGLMALTLADRVRNPAAVIKWTSRRLLDRGEVSDRAKERLSAIMEQADRLETTVRDFQGVLQSRQSMFAYEDINEIVSEVLSLVRTETANKGIDLVVNLSAQPVKINAQRDLLRVAAFNLMKNALEATPEGGVITVSTSGDNDRVILAVSDTGPGIPDEVRERIFDPFFSTKTRRYGMGLPLLRQIVSEHMGRIEVESRAGKGTTFRVFFPARWAETEKQEGRSA